jgi:2'-5' RNA ligase
MPPRCPPTSRPGPVPTDRPMNETEPRHRLFFALWPDASLRRSLAALAPRRGPRRMRVMAPEDLHLTLVFLGTATSTQLDCARDRASRLRVETFELIVDRLGGFGRSGIYWAGASQTPDALAHLVRELQKGALACDFAVDDRLFRPHITLARRAHGMRADAIDPPLRWIATDFCLVETVSMEGSARYRVRERWALSGPSTTVG